MSQFSATRDFGIRRPTIPSLAAAQAEFNHWLKENTFERLYDARGMAWIVKTRLRQGPGPRAEKGAWYRLEVMMLCELAPKALVDSGLLDKDSDARLLAFLSPKDPPVLHLNLGSWEDCSLNGIIGKFGQLAENTKASWHDRDFSQEQRRCIGQWVNERLSFKTHI